jgi:hypothetical protein
MLRSRSSGGRLVRSTPRQNTRPRSMRKGGALKELVPPPSTPRKFVEGSIEFITCDCGDSSCTGINDFRGNDNCNCCQGRPGHQQH